MKRADVAIVGSGHAGAAAAIALRQKGFAGSIALIGEEDELPYERPPLSKEYLVGDRPVERLLLRPAAFWRDRDVTLLPGRRVVAVDPDAHVVAIGGGERIGYGTLIWAAGGHARRLDCPGHDLAGIHTIRTRADVDLLVADLPRTSTAIVVGGGYIGLEAAAALIRLGKAVTIVEREARLLARVAGDALSSFYAAEHRARGVDLLLGAGVVAVEGRDGRAGGVRLTDGAAIAGDMVIVGIGIVPATAPLHAAGARGGDGVEVDEGCRTSLPDIYAIGDCAAHRNRHAGGALVRLESVQNANDQAAVVADALTGGGSRYDVVPWFWSNQYDLKLQTVGLSARHDRAIVRGDPSSRRFSVVYLRNRRVIALDCVNATRDYVQGRALVAAGAAIDPALLADDARPLKELAAAAAAGA